MQLSTYTLTYWFTWWWVLERSFPGNQTAEHPPQQWVLQGGGMKLKSNCSLLWDSGSDRNVSSVTVCVTGQPRTREYIEFPQSLLGVSKAAAQGGGSALHIAVIYWWGWVRAFSFPFFSLFICYSVAIPFPGFPAQVRGSRGRLCSVTAICRCDWDADGTSFANP